MNPVNMINLRSHHSLKSSALTDTNYNQHMNPLSSRTSLTKKLSLNSKIDGSYITSGSKPNLPAQNYQIIQDYRNINGSLSKSQLFIPLGNKNKEINNRQHAQNNAYDLKLKIDVILDELSKNNKRLLFLEQKIMLLQTQRQDLLSSINYQSKNQTNQIKTELYSLTKKLNQINSRRLHETVTQIQQNTFNQKTHQINKKFQEQLRLIKDNFIMNIEHQKVLNEKQIDQKIQILSERISEYIEKTKSKWLEKSSVGDFINKFRPIFKNSDTRLKFMGTISLIQGLTTKNPQDQQKLNQIIVERIQRHYKIDIEGFLLDQDQRYILDGIGNKVQLSSQQINILMRMKILSSCQSSDLNN